jgi:hypothetical protein
VTAVEVYLIVAPLLLALVVAVGTVIGVRNLRRN